VQLPSQQDFAGHEFVVAARTVGSGIADEDDLFDILAGVLLTFVVVEVAVGSRDEPADRHREQSKQANRKVSQLHGRGSGAGRRTGFQPVQKKYKQSVT